MGVTYTTATGATYVPIASITSTSGSVTFTSIPSTYTDLVLISYVVATTGNGNATIQVGNGSIDTGANYSDTILSGNGTTAASSRDSNVSVGMYLFNYSTSGSANITHFMNYSNATTYKTMLSRYNDAAYGTLAAVGLWRSTSAINQIKVVAAGSTTASTFALYGILGA